MKLYFSAILALPFSAILWAQQYTISTIAGGGAPPTPANALQSSIGSPQAFATDATGNLYFTSLNCIFKVATSGTMTRIAGTGAAGFSGDGGTATSAQLNVPGSLAIDSTGNIYVVDNSRVRKISTAGVITTVAGGGTGGDGGPATSAVLNPMYIAVDSAANIYINDSAATIRKVSGGIITTFAGGGTASPGDGGMATNAAISPQGNMAFDSANNLYFPEIGRLRMVTPGGTISTIAGDGTSLNSGSSLGNGGPTASAKFDILWTVAVNAAGTKIYMIDGGKIREISGGTINVVSALQDPTELRALAVDPSGNLYAYTSPSIFQMTPGGTVTAIAGNNFVADAGDGGSATSAVIGEPSGIAVDPSGNLYIGDAETAVVRKVSGGTITTFAGNGNQTTTAQENVSALTQSVDGLAVAADSAGNLYVTGRPGIRKITGTTITTVAGGGNISNPPDGTPALSASLGTNAIAVDSMGVVYYSDTTNGVVRKIQSDGTLKVVAGGGTASPGNGGLATSASISPGPLAVDGAGNIYIGDFLLNRLVMVNTNGILSTVANVSVFGITTDPYNHLFYVAGCGVWVVRSDGTQSQVAGLPVPPLRCGDSGDGGPATNAELGLYENIAYSQGNLYLADGSNGVVRLLQLTPLSITAPAVLPGALSGQPYSFALTANGGFTPYTWLATNGSLPQGLSLSSSGVISGTPQNPGSSTFTALLEDGQRSVLTRTYTLYVTAAMPSITNLLPSSAVAGTSALNVLVNGSGFLNGASTVLWNASPRSTTFINPNQLRATLTSADLATSTTSSVTVSNSSPGVGTSPAATFTVLASCTYTLSATSFSLNGASFTGSINVSTAAGCTWTAASNASFLTVTPGPWGSGSDTVNFTVAVNAGASRTGTLTIAGQTVTVMQSGPAGLGKQYTITTFAGGGTYPQSPRLATNLSIGAPRALAFDSLGNLYFTSSAGYAFKMDTTGLVVVIGAPLILSGADSLGFIPGGIAVDQSGNVYIGGGTPNNRNLVQTISPSGSVATFAGGGSTTPATGVAATSARFSMVGDLAFDGAGNLYVGDTTAGVVVKIAPNGVIASVLSTSVGHMTVDQAGDIYFSSGAAFVTQVKVAAVNGTISVVAGNGSGGDTGDGGPATSATLEPIEGLVVDSSGNLYISDVYGHVREVSGGNINRIGGVPPVLEFVYSGDGGIATHAQMGWLNGMALDANGNLYVADTYRIRVISPAGLISTVAGNGTAGASGDGGPALGAQISQPRGLAIDSSGNLYVAESYSNVARKITSGGTISTFAGTGMPTASFSSGLPTNTPLNQPVGIAIDGFQNIFIAVGASANVEEVNSASAGTVLISNVAGKGALTPSGTGDGGPATSGAMTQVAAVTFDSLGNMYIADSTGNRVRKVADSVITTLAGTGTGAIFGSDGGFSGDGSAAVSAKLNFPDGVAADAAGNVYIADSRNNRVRIVPPNGNISTFAGGGTAVPGDGGLATNANLGGVSGVAVDNSGNVLIASGNQIRQVSPSGIITTIAGSGSQGFSGDGGPAINAQLNGPQAIYVAPNGTIYISDTGNNRIRTLAPLGLSVASTATLPTAAYNWPYAQPLAASGGTMPYAWQMTSGNLPTGLTLNSDGSFSGTVNSTAATTFNALLTDGTNTTSSGSFTLPVGYMVGDVLPNGLPGSNALGSFGDGTLNTLDLIAVLRAVTNLTVVPPSCSDLFDAMDTFPVDTPGHRGGDGKLNTLDLIEILKRVTGLDTTPAIRTPRNACSGMSAQMRERPHAGPTAGTITLERLAPAADGSSRTAIYLTSNTDSTLDGLSLSVSGGSSDALRFEASGPATDLVDSGIPGALAIAWMKRIDARAGMSLLLGVVDAAPGAALKIGGVSAVVSGQEVNLSVK